MDIANATGLAGVAMSDEFGSAVYLGVDSSISQNPRASTRVQSNDVFNSSTLWIADIRHQPGSICGIWSAYWLVGPNWPVGGEIDLMEQINMATSTKYVLHTNSSLSVTNFSDPATANSTGMGIRGTFSSTNCTTTPQSNTGCVVEGVNNTFGAGWNANGGGVIAMEYLEEAISVWQFGRTEIPADIFSGTPDPSSWRQRDAHFMSADGSSLDDYFFSLQQVFNIDICGSWPDKVWATSECASLAPSCEAYVGQNPQAFSEAYFLIDGIQMYQPSNASMNGTSMPAPGTNMTARSERSHRVRRDSNIHW